MITLTGSARPNPHGVEIPAYPFNFTQPDKLVASLRGADTLYNTYWVRFDHGDTTHSRAVANTQMLFQAAKAAGVRRIVHVSISSPALDSPLPYFRGNAQLEQAIQNSSAFQ